MRAYQFILLVVVSGYLSGCKNCANKKGELQVFSHVLQPFNEMEIEGKFNIMLQQSDTHRISLNGYQGINETVRYDVVEGKLLVTNENNCSNLNGYDDWVNLTIEMDSFSFARFSVPGSLDSKGELNWSNCSLLIDNCNLETNLKLKMTNFVLNLDGGTSTVHLSGANTTSEITFHGNGHVYAKNLMNKDLYAYSRGTGYMEATVSNYLLASIQGSAELVYYGSPLTEEIKLKPEEGASVTKMN